MENFLFNEKTIEKCGCVAVLDAQDVNRELHPEYVLHDTFTECAKKAQVEGKGAETQLFDLLREIFSVA